MSIGIVKERSAYLIFTNDPGDNFLDGVLYINERAGGWSPGSDTSVVPWVELDMKFKMLL